MQVNSVSVLKTQSPIQEIIRYCWIFAFWPHVSASDSEIPSAHKKIPAVWQLEVRVEKFRTKNIFKKIARGVTVSDYQCSSVAAEPGTWEFPTLAWATNLSCWYYAS